MRILFALPGLHRVNRGAEVAFEEVARCLAMMPGHEVTLVGSGTPRPDSPYRFVHVGCVPRERFEGWPRLPGLRGHYCYEELTFAAGLLSRYRPADFDVTVTCAYPYTNWLLRTRGGRHRPAHVYVTQNGDWPLRANRWEYRFFSCDGLACTNPEYYDRYSGRYPSALIPNGVDPDVYRPGDGDRARFGLPGDRPVVLMVSALIPSKRVPEGVRAVAGVPGAHLVVAGDGEQRAEVRRLAAELLPGRFSNITVPREEMPHLYRCADAFLHMSQDEPFGNVYIEALASGLPVVAHDRSVTRWALEGHATYVDTSNLAAASSALSATLSRGREHDIALKREMVARRFSWKSIAASYSTFFRTTLERRAGGSASDVISCPPVRLGGGDE